MVDFVSSLGRHLGTVEGLEFYEFPSLERLLAVSEKEFRDAGFGYRLTVLSSHTRLNHRSLFVAFVIFSKLWLFSIGIHHSYMLIWF